MKPRSPAGAIIGGAGLLAIAVWAISEGRMPTANQMIGDITMAETPRLFWGYVGSIGAIGIGVFIWGLLANFRR